VAACAAHGGASLIVTSNLKDFRQLPPGLMAIHPDDFLCLLLDETPAALLAAVGAQVSRLTNPPMSLPDLLDRYALIAPKFVSAWRARFPD
jgi:hypothetical protein